MGTHITTSWGGTLPRVLPRPNSSRVYTTRVHHRASLPMLDCTDAPPWMIDAACDTDPMHDQSRKKKPNEFTQTAVPEPTFRRGVASIADIRGDFFFANTGGKMGITVKCQRSGFLSDRVRLQGDLTAVRSRDNPLGIFPEGYGTSRTRLTSLIRAASGRAQGELRPHKTKVAKTAN